MRSGECPSIVEQVNCIFFRQRLLFTIKSTPKFGNSDASFAKIKLNKSVWTPRFTAAALHTHTHTEKITAKCMKKNSKTTMC